MNSLKHSKKSGLILRDLSLYFMEKEIGENILSIQKLSEKFDVARGTIQDAILTMELDGAIFLLKKGRRGTEILRKDLYILIKYLGKNEIKGCSSILDYKNMSDIVIYFRNTLKDIFNISYIQIYSDNFEEMIFLLKNNTFDFLILEKGHIKESVEIEVKSIDDSFEMLTLANNTITKLIIKKDKNN